MEKKIFTIMAIAVITVLTCSCKRDPIHGVEPVTNAFYTDAGGYENFPLDQFHKLGQTGDTLGQRNLVNAYRKQLTANVIRQYPTIKDASKINFLLGSGFAKDVISGNGKTYSGKFKNELIIIIDDVSVQDTLFLACGNGMLSPLQLKDSHNFGNAEPWRFTILPGEGLANHLPELQAWAEVASELSIPIKDKAGKIVSSETYLNYLGRYQSYLFPYDVVDVLKGIVYNKAGQEVDFERRLAEAEKVKADKLKAKKSKKAVKRK